MFPRRQIKMNGSNRCVALLPMKANSQRVKGKNFRPLHGKPLFAWVLDSLLSIDAIDAVVINTDARDILAECGLRESKRIIIRDRKPELCGDTVSMNRILADDIAAVPAETYLMTHTTNPMLSRATIFSALSAYHAAVKSGQGDSLFTVNKIQTRFYRADGSAVNHDPANLIQTQDLEPWFEENSNLYVFSPASFAAANARIGKKPVLHVMDKTEAIDIDTPEDWALAEAVAAVRYPAVRHPLASPAE
ncbi:MAG: cytidylyltransferase domain-containing protein [Paracoccaceae bacterium]